MKRNLVDLVVIIISVIANIFFIFSVIFTNTKTEDPVSIEKTETKNIEKTECIEKLFSLLNKADSWSIQPTRYLPEIKYYINIEIDDNSFWIKMVSISDMYSEIEKYMNTFEKGKGEEK